MISRDADEVLLAFVHALRVAGVAVTPDRAQTFLAAVAVVGADTARGVHLAGRATLCASPDDLARFDLVFPAFFSRHAGPRQAPADRSRTTARAPLPDRDGDSGPEEGESEVIRALVSDTDVLRSRDIAELSADDRRRLAGLFASLHPRPPLRRTARHQRWHRGEVDVGRTLRNALRQGGEAAELARRRRGRRPRRVILLVDVSGSMRAYADALLRFAHRCTVATRRQGGTVETFTVGTRLTHVTRALRTEDPERALAAAGATVPDWSGGTRLGESLQVFLDRWGRPGMARGAVVVVFSDGWERGEPDLLADQAARLRRIAHRVIWATPHQGRADYEPVQRGVLAVLPHCDHFVAGHSLAAFAEVAELVARS
ncbi:VWA domain-containing protein [Nakamurella flava]|uniref:VWA domain-containing protein n=1 Tax=Nakamurella flava TaxID=2576308 RepID=A0A4U6QCD0_9ACTN|nr:VWA domain-containing protein [Nakamurella flava]TKV57744.1 VWA domain-containing protein [Nakamurella flava]